VESLARRRTLRRFLTKEEPTALPVKWEREVMRRSVLGWGRESARIRHKKKNGFSGVLKSNYAEVMAGRSRFSKRGPKEGASSIGKEETLLRTAPENLHSGEENLGTNA